MSHLEDMGRGAGSSQWLHHLLFPNSQSLPKPEGSFSRHEGGPSSTSHLPIGFPTPGQSMEGFQLSRELQIYFLMHSFCTGKLPKSTLKKKKKTNLPQDTSPICGCRESLLWEQTGTSWSRVPPREDGKFSGAKTMP